MKSNNASDNIIVIFVPADHKEYYHMSAVTYAMLVYVRQKLDNIPYKERTQRISELLFGISAILDKSIAETIFDNGIPEDIVARTVVRCKEYTKHLTVHIDCFVDNETGIIYRTQKDAEGEPNE